MSVKKRLYLLSISLLLSLAIVRVFMPLLHHHVSCIDNLAKTTQTTPVSDDDCVLCNIITTATEPFALFSFISPLQNYVIAIFAVYKTTKYFSFTPQISQRGPPEYSI